MRLHIKKLTIEQYANIMFCTVYGFNLIMFTFNNLMRIVVGNTFYLDSVFMFICYGFFLVHALPRLIKEMKIQYWFFLLILILLPILTCQNTAVTSKILSEIVPFCILAFMFGCGIKDYALTWRYLYKFSWLVLAMAFFDTFILKLFTETSHMLGYAALFPACVLAIEILNNKHRKVLNILALVLSCVLVVQADTTGALVAVALTILVALCYSVKKIKKGAFFVIVIIISMVAIILNNINRIAIMLMNRLAGFGVNVNALEEMAGTGITTDRFRDSIYEYCFGYAKQHWFLGCGVGTDRYLITQHTLVHDQTMVSNYPHNIFLEFMIQYGLILGLFLSVVVVIFIIRYLAKEKDLDAQKIAVLVVGMGFFPLMYSSSYIESPFFYILMGFAWKRLNYMRINHKK